MASYQDIESRLRVVEEKIDFALQAFAVQRTERSRILGGRDQTVTRTLLEVYREMKGAGLAPVDLMPKNQADDVIDAEIEQAIDEEVV